MPNNRIQYMTDPPNVLIIFTHLIKGGAQVQYLNFIKSVANDYNFHIATIKDSGILTDRFLMNNIPVENLDFKRKISLSGFLRLIRYIRKSSFQIVITVGYGDSMFWGRLAAIFMNIKIIYCSLHTFPDIGGRITFSNRLLNSFTTRFLPCTSELTTVLEKKYRISAEKITTFHDGINVSNLEKIKIKASGKSQSFLAPILSSCRTILVQIGSLEYYKNQILTLETIHQLIYTDQMKSIFLIFIGDGGDKKILQDYIIQKGLSDFVKITGHLSHGECLNLLEKSHIVLSSSISEAFPNNLLEGAVLKKPIVASDVGGVKEIVIHNKTGFLFTSGDKEQYLEYIQKLIKSPELQKRFGEFGHRFVVNNYTMTKKITKFNAFVNEDFNRYIDK